MRDWKKLKDMDGIDRYSCCDYIMGDNSTGEIYCKKFDISLGFDKTATLAALSFCGNYNTNNDLCFAKQKCIIGLADRGVFDLENKMKDSINIQNEYIKKNPDDPNGYKTRGAYNCMIFNEFNTCRCSLNSNYVKAIDEHFGSEFKKYANSAISDFSAAIKLDSGDAEAYASRGGIFAINSQIKDSTKALADFSKAIELDNKCKNAYLFRGSLYSDKGEYEKAIFDLECALELSPNDEKETASFVLNNARKLKKEENEKRQREYDNAVSQFNRLKNQTNMTSNGYKIAADSYRSLVNEFKKLSDFKNTDNFVEQCQKNVAECNQKYAETLSIEEETREIEAKEKKKKTIISVALFVCLTIGYLVILWGTNIVSTPWTATGFTIVQCLPLAFYSLAVGLINFIYLKNSNCVLILVGMIFVQSITACVWEGNVGFLFIYLIGRALLNTISAIPGAILAWLYKEEKA